MSSGDGRRRQGRRSRPGPVAARAPASSIDAGHGRDRACTLRGVIVVVGNPVARSAADGPATAAGLPAGVAIAAVAGGATAQIVGRVGEDAAGEAALLDLARHGVGHAAIMRDPGRPTPVLPAPGDDDAVDADGGAATADISGASTLDARRPQARLRLPARVLGDRRRRAARPGDARRGRRRGCVVGLGARRRWCGRARGTARRRHGLRGADRWRPRGRLRGDGRRVRRGPRSRRGPEGRVRCRDRSQWARTRPTDARPERSDRNDELRAVVADVVHELAHGRDRELRLVARLEHRQQPAAVGEAPDRATRPSRPRGGSPASGCGSSPSPRSAQT